MWKTETSRGLFSTGKVLRDIGKIVEKGKFNKSHLILLCV